MYDGDVGDGAEDAVTVTTGVESATERRADMMGRYLRDMMAVWWWW